MSFPHQGLLSAVLLGGLLQVGLGVAGAQTGYVNGTATYTGGASGLTAQGGAGGDGGGGGAGLGGALFLDGSAVVVLNGVSYTGNRAVGGNGGSTIEDFDGGGGGVAAGGGTGGNGGGILTSGRGGNGSGNGVGGVGGGGGGSFGGSNGGNGAGGGGGARGGLAPPEVGGGGGGIGSNDGFGGGGGGDAPQGGSNGGFGGGGGNAAQSGTPSLPGGVGGGDGGSIFGEDAGGGGAGFGGAIFVRSGASLTIEGNSAFSGNSVSGGARGVNLFTTSNAGDGAAAGSDLFVMTGATLTLSPGTGNTITFADADSIADDSANSIPGGPHTRAGTGAGAVVAVSGGGTVVFERNNTYAGGTTLDGDGHGGQTVLQIRDSASLGSGAVTFGANSAGGVLQFGADSLSVANAVTVGQFGGTIDTNGHSGTLSGVVSGAGTFIKVGTGTLTLSGANTYTGATTISAGTLALSSGGVLFHSSGVNVASGATLNLSGASEQNSIQALSGAGTVFLGSTILNEKATQSTTFSGQINGTGTLFVDGAANTFTLTGLNGYTGLTLIEMATLALGNGGSIAASSGVSVQLGGTLDISGGGSQTIQSLFGSGSVTLGSNTLTIGTADDTAFSGVVSGTGGGLTKQGIGMLTLSGANTYTGLTTINGGTLEIDGSLASGQVEVNNGAVLRGTGTVGPGIGDVNVHAGGTLAAGSATAPGKLTVASDLTFLSGSTLSLRVADATHHDSVQVSGNVTVNPGSTLRLDLGGGLLGGDTLTLVKAGGGFTGTFSTQDVTSNLNNALTFQTATVQGAGGELDLNIVAVQNSFVPFAGNGNETALARILDHVAADPREAQLIGFLNGLPGSQLPAAFTEIVPVQQTVVEQTSLQTSRASFGTLQNRMSNVRAGSTGLSMNQFNWLDQNIPAASLIAGTELPTGVKAFTPAPDNRWGFFAAANGNFGDIDGQTSQSNYNGAGFTVGSDYRLNNAFAVGFAVGYDYSKTDFDHSGSNSTANSIRFGPYATWHDKTGDWVDGTLGGAYHFYDSNRDTVGGTATSNTNGVEFDSSVKYGHDFHVRQWTLTPTFGFDYLHLDINSYTESGSLAPLAVRDQSVDSFRSNLGGTVAYGFQWRGIGWNPYVQAGWAHEFLDADQAVSARFASGAGDVFTTTGDNLGHESATFGAGLQAAFSEMLTANLSYAGEANGQYQDHSFNAAVRMEF